jgi:hypothetical protein
MTAAGTKREMASLETDSRSDAPKEHAGAML